MRALTVQQPWAWAILHGGKDVENRTWSTPHRGQLLIHAGAQTDQAGVASPLVQAALEANPQPRPELELRPGGEAGSIIGAVDLVDVHLARPGCCPSEWGERPDQLDVLHWELANPRPLEAPVRCRGKLQLWTPPYDVAYQVARQLGSAA